MADSGEAAPVAAAEAEEKPAEVAGGGAGGSEEAAAEPAEAGTKKKRKHVSVPFACDKLRMGRLTRGRHLRACPGADGPPLVHLPRRVLSMYLTSCVA